jgi:hypothetical protein
MIIESKEFDDEKDSLKEKDKRNQKRMLEIENKVLPILDSNSSVEPQPKRKLQSPTSLSSSSSSSSFTHELFQVRNKKVEVLEQRVNTLENTLVAGFADLKDFMVVAIKEGIREIIN